MATVVITITDSDEERVSIGFDCDHEPLPVTQAHKVGFIVHELLQDEAMFQEVQGMVLENHLNSYLEDKETHEAH